MRAGTSVVLLALLHASVAVASGDAGPRSFPGARLEIQVEAHLDGDRASLKQNFGHYALVFPVEQSDLVAFMRQIRVFGRPGDLVLGTEYGVESHGGGVLALLFDLWRPENRAAKLDDRFRFEQNDASIPLAALYASLLNQVFQPVPGRTAAQIDGALPDTPQLARVRMHLPGGGATETDAYHALGLLAVHEPDLEAVHTNALGQRLSAALLLDHARRYYLASRDAPAQPKDHSNLHLVEVLLAASRRTGRDPEEIQRHFLAVELQRRDFDPKDATELIGHHAESLGRLVADPRVRWSEAEREQARAWLEWLEETWFRDHDLRREEPEGLTHLLFGLRLIRENRSRLEAAD